MEYISVESSNIEKIGYDDQKRQFHILFLKKIHYIYYDVPVKTYEEFLASDSKGRFFAQFIKGMYAYQNVTGQVETD